MAKEVNDEEISMAEFVALVQNELQQALEYLSTEKLRVISKVTPSPTFVTFNKVKLTVPVKIRAAIQPLPIEITDPALILKKGFIIPRIEVCKEKAEEPADEVKKEKERMREQGAAPAKEERMSMVPQYKLKVRTVGGPETPPVDDKMGSLEISFVLVTKE